MTDLARGLGGEKSTGAAPASPAGMAILDPDGLGTLPGPAPERLRQGERPGGLDGHVGAAVRVRRHALRRLLVADVVGLAFAALLGPLILVGPLRQPGRGVGDGPGLTLRRGHDPPVRRGVRGLRAVPGHPPASLDQRVQRSPQHRARPHDQRLHLRPGRLRRRQALPVRVPERGHDHVDVPGGRGDGAAGPGAGLRDHRPRLGGCGAGHRGRDREARPDRRQPPARPCRACSSWGSSTTTRSAGAT